MNKRSFNSNHLKFLLAGIIILVLLDRFVLDGTRPYIEEARQEARTAQVIYKKEPAESSQIKNEITEQETVLARLEPEIGQMEQRREYRRYTEPLGPENLPAWRKHAVPVTLDPEKAKVVIVIDDLGVSREYSQDILELPGPLTLAFLPYAAGLEPLVEKGRARGHEIMVHMPMEPMNGQLDTGAIFLSTEQGPAEFDDMLGQGLDAFGGYVGINNHMGSRLTQDREAMEKVMATLYRKGLLFLDSRTIGSSVAAETAAAYNVPYAVRDVFLDHDESLAGVRASLKRTEEIALEYGQAIAIGHPKPNTIQGLQEWLPTLADKGIQLVPVSATAITTPSADPPASLAGEISSEPVR